MELAIRLNNRCDLYFGVIDRRIKANRYKVRCTNAFKVVEFLLFGHKLELAITQADLDDPNHPAYQVTEAQVKDIENAVDSHIMKNESNRI